MILPATPATHPFPAWTHQFRVAQQLQPIMDKWWQMIATKGETLVKSHLCVLPCFTLEKGWLLPLIPRNRHKLASHKYHRLAYAPCLWIFWHTPTLPTRGGFPHQHRHGFVLGLGHWEYWIGSITKFEMSLSKIWREQTAMMTHTHTINWV